VSALAAGVCLREPVAICRQGESAVPVVEVCRQHGISEQT
jgi:hypothetical protein